MAVVKDHGRHFPILALPTELRHAVYRCILFTRNKKVEVVSNLLEQGPAVEMRFYTTCDLSLLETNKQIRIEAGDLFYVESLFTLNSYPRKQEYRQEPLYGEKCFQIFLSRVRKCHVLTPRGTDPRSHDECVISVAKLGTLLQGIVDGLAGGHCMRYLLVQSYSFERAVLSDETTLRCDLAPTLEPLEQVQGLHLCYIRAMKTSHWPYLRYLEREMTRSGSGPQDGGEPCESVWKRALKRREALKEAGDNNDFRDPDLPHANEIFKVFGIEPLYRGVGFLKNYEDDLLV